MSKHALVIGCNGGIGREVVTQLCASDDYTAVHCVSRTTMSNPHHKVQAYQFDSSDEEQVNQFATAIKQQGVKFSLVICTTGVLHASGDIELKPEKRLEDINGAQISEYFRVNSIIPALWLKALVGLVARQQATIVCFSARVGSIAENALGGWYGYRASKAALNMLVKTASIEYKRRAPNVSLVCYHPGTVDTHLSKPFQANVAPEKLFTTEYTTAKLLDLVTRLSPEQSPYYLDYKGETIQY